MPHSPTPRNPKPGSPIPGSPMPNHVPTLACVILTMGNRPIELGEAIASVLDQVGPPIDVIVLINGSTTESPVEVPAGVRVHVQGENLGIPGGRNEGVALTSADVVLFLDDDGRYPDATMANRLRAAFAEDSDLGIVSFRIVDPDTGRTERRHVPRLRAVDPERSSEVTTFLGGACAIRRLVFEQAGLQPAQFFYGHEESDLAWRALDHGWRIRYDAGVLMYHPGLAPTRHAQFFRMNARNRVWLARRRLPALLLPVYLTVWAILTLLRTRSLSGLKAWAGGFREGWSTDPGERSPMKWSTVWRMTKLGRPPVI